MSDWQTSDRILPIQGLYIAPGVIRLRLGGAEWSPSNLNFKLVDAVRYARTNDGVRRAAEKFRPLLAGTNLPLFYLYYDGRRAACYRWMMI